MNVAVMTDTNGAISIAEGKSLGIYVLPMPVQIENQWFTEEVDLSSEAFFSVLREGRHVCTSQPAPGALMGMWDSILAEGYDEIVYIPMAGGLSGSCQAAKRFSQEYDGRVCVADTNRVSATQRFAVLDALAMVRRGMRAAEICTTLEAEGQNANIFIALDTIEYLKRGGRTGNAAAALASILNIKPVIRIQNGQIHVEEKVRGVKRARRCMLEAIRSELEGTFASFPQEQILLVTAGSLASEAESSAWCEQVHAEFPQYPVGYWPLSCSLSGHIGPDGCGVGIVVSRFAQEHAAALTK